MKNFSHLINNPLFSGSAIVFAGSTIANIVNYFYHLIIGRMLGPSSYGDLSSLISLINLLSVLPGSISLVIVKYASASKNDAERSMLISWLRKKIFHLTVLYFVVILLLSPFISSFLHINEVGSVMAVAVILFISLPAILNRSILQGLLKFKEMVGSILIENITKLVISILLIYLGFGLGGALAGFIVAGIISWYFTNKNIKSYFKKGLGNPIYIKAMLLYTIPILIQSITLTSLYSSDLVLIKHFFSPHDSGIYASISVLGKIIFFGTAPITAVMFPLVSQKFTLGQDYKKIFVISVIASLVLSVAILLIYWLFPQIVINILYGKDYIEGVNLLIWSGIFMTLFTLCSLIINFHLSLGNSKVILLPIIASISQIILIWYNHTNLFTVIIMSIFIAALLLAFLLIYSFHNFNEKSVKN